MIELTDQESQPTPLNVDVCVIGAGVAGNAVAYALGSAGYRVALVDPRSQCTPCFKAEKVEPNQAALFRELGLMEMVIPIAHRISEVVSARGRRPVGLAKVEQYGIHYHHLVNALRAKAATVSQFVLGRVSHVAKSGDAQEISLSDGRKIGARLVVLAAGVSSGKLHDQLGFSREMVSPQHSMAYGFSIEPVGKAEFDFDSVTYMPSKLDQRVDYVTFFPLADGMRVNLFVYQAPKDEDVRAFLTDMHGTLKRLVPGMFDVVGDFRVVGKVESFPIDLYVVGNLSKDGIVLIGDACQSVCPATGTGLTKVLTDAVVLSKVYAPKWLSKTGVTSNAIAEFYNDARKRVADTYSLDAARTHRSIALDYSLRFRVHRSKLYTLRMIDGLLRRVRGRGLRA